MTAALRGMGVERGDRVVAYAPNIPEAIVALPAAASIGAVWSSCSLTSGPPA
ncbi:MAG: AMP-binding protein [Solirubrobacterales bacterium]